MIENKIEEQPVNILWKCVFEWHGLATNVDIAALEMRKGALILLQMKSLIRKQNNAPLLNSVHSGVLLLQPFLVWYDQ